MTVRVWTCTPNQPPASSVFPAQAQSVFRALKDCIKNAGHTVLGSSDGASAAMDGTDRITADNKVIFGDNSTPVAHSWIAFQTPTNNPSTGKHVYIILACSAGAANPHKINVYITSQAPTGGTTTTADPVTVGGLTRTLANLQFLRSPAAPSQYHAAYNTSGDFLFHTSPNGVGYASFSFGYVTTANFEAGLNYPCIAWGQWTDSGSGALILGTFDSNATAGFMQDGSLATAAGLAGYTAFGSLGGSTLVTDRMNGSQGTIASPGKWGLLSVGMFLFGTPSGGASTIGIGGSLVDIYLAPNGTSTPQMTEEPASPAPSELGKVGSFMIVTGGTTFVF